MMARGYFFRQEEDDLFFDPREDLSSVFDSCPTSPATSLSSLTDDSSVMEVINDPLSQVWIMSPGSIHERRAKFMQLMGLDDIRSDYPGFIVPDNEPRVEDIIKEDIDRISSDSGAVLSSVSENESPMSCISDDVSSTCQVRSSDDQFEYAINGLNDRCVFLAQGSNRNSSGRSLWEDEKIHLSSLRRNISSSSSNSDKRSKKKRIGWLRRLGAVACIVDRKSLYFDAEEASDPEESASVQFQKIRVGLHRKGTKEFSAVYNVQNIKAHLGAILSMKFSPDGQYLASAGEDGVVRVWKVMERSRTGKNDIPNDDSACIYFTLGPNTEVSPLHAVKEKFIKFKTSRSTSDSACVVVPPYVFRISEKPLYEFHGHKGNVLDLAWSKDKYLLSSSTDKTVRLWLLGCDRCLKVFAHNNYVTCIQFNPADERYFISGSLDGKVRIWEIPTCRVANWADIKEIITAVCYQPDGKGFIVGSIMGDCCFYASDNRLQLDRKFSFEGKKKSVERRITGFQFCPTDSRRLIVSSADSVIRILDGFNVVSKYKGFQNSGSPISAAFTPDGKHIISASEDSKVYIWNHSTSNDHANSKSIRSSEFFTSSHACIAVPWQGSSSKLEPLNSTLYLSPQCRSSILSYEFFAEILRRGSATWPEEKLPPPLSKLPSSGDPHFSFLKNSSHAWGQVIVTAGWDGRIRSFQNYGLPVHL